jgi:hypothetical protein
LGRDLKVKILKSMPFSLLEKPEQAHAMFPARQKIRLSPESCLRGAVERFGLREIDCNTTAMLRMTLE